MKLPLLNRVERSGRRTSGLKAHTLVEILVSVSVFSLLVLGIVGAHLFGLRIFQIGQVKLLATDQSRKAIYRMTDDIRMCGAAYVGDVTNGLFIARNDGESQQGTALLLYPTNGNTNFILYFRNAADQTFRRTTTVLNTTTIIVGSVTNTNVFRVEDCLGNTLTNTQNNRVFRCSLGLYQPGTTNPVANYYKMETAVTRRLLQ